MRIERFEKKKFAEKIILGNFFFSYTWLIFALDFAGLPF